MFKKTKLHHYYNKLSKEQAKRFNLFISSPYFNSTNYLIEFWDCFMDTYQRNEDISLIDFYRIYRPNNVPKGDLTDKQEKAIANKVRKLNTEVFNHLNNFIGLEIYQSNPMLMTKHSYDGMVQLDSSGSHKENNFDVLKNSMNVAPHSSAKFILQNRIWADQLSAQHKTKNQPQITSVENAINYLDTYYFTERLFYEIERQTLKRRFAFDIQEESFKDVLPLFKHCLRKDEKSPLTNGAYLLYLAYTEGKKQKTSNKAIFSDRKSSSKD